MKWSLLYKKEIYLSQWTMIFKKDYGRQEDFVHGLMNGMVSRFSLSSPAPFKGDFFLTSRFEQLDGQESFESWIKIFG